jgi:hypothetical protein
MRKTKCDSQGICKIKEGEDCRGNADMCIDVLLCDAFKECRPLAGANCISSNSCPAGAQCIENQCVCNTQFTVQHGGSCSPKAGYPGGFCLNDKDCLNNARCVKEDGFNVCHCDNIESKRYLTCTLILTSKSVQDNTLQIIIIVLLACLGLILIAVAVRRSRKASGKRDKVFTEYENRMQEITDLRFLAEEVSQAPLPVKAVQVPLGVVQVPCGHAQEIHAHEIHAFEIHAHETQAHEIGNVYESGEQQQQQQQQQEPQPQT